MTDTIPDTSISDETLMDRFKEGDETAFVELYNRYRRRVYAYCIRMISSQDQADDLFQEVFIRVARKRHRFLAGSFSAWLFAIARNLCLNAIRDRVSHVALEDVADSLQTAADEAEYDQSLEILKEAIDHLPADLREPLVLRVYSGLSYQEIADLTQAKLATVKVRIFRAKQRLHEMLAPYFMDRV
ncbi:MAG TPA: RNA polymerase sigma factor [Candidatus Kapabacteria bacterium]|nr:RNA polymerase sigma factor [Candidatus Kapabacteria bacterium]